jgi:hypothetical protein
LPIIALTTRSTVAFGHGVLNVHNTEDVKGENAEESITIRPRQEEMKIDDVDEILNEGDE